MQRDSLLRSRLERPGEGIVLSLAVLVGLAITSPGFAFQEQPSDATLKPGFQPPRPTPRTYQIEDEKITDADFDTWNKTQRIDYHTAMAARSLDTVIKGKTVKDRIKEGIRIRVARFSLKSQRSELRDRRRELVTQDIDLRVKTPDVREYVLQQVVEQCQTLLTGNFHVRMHAVFVVSELNIQRQKIGAGARPAVANPGGVPFLISVLSETIDGKPVPQPQAVRIRAARGLQRILTVGNIPKVPNDKTRIAIARVLLAELDDNPDEAYEFVLLHVLAEVGIPLIDQKPDIVTALARVMVDTTRSYRNRCRAARLLGKTPMPGGVKSAPIAWGAAQLGHQIVSQYGTRIRRVHAIFYFQDLYYAFVPPPGEATSDGKQRAGLLSTLKTPQINEAYGVIMPIMAFFVKALGAKAAVPPPTILQVLRQNLSDVKDKKPADMSIWNGEPPIDQKKIKSPEERPGTPAG